MIAEGRKDRIYRRPDSSLYYLDYTDPYTGRRIRKSSGKHTYEEAMEVLEVLKNTSKQDKNNITLSDIISLYEDPSTNPRKKQADIDGTSYGIGHAKHVAYLARKLRSEMEKLCPKFLNLKIVKITRMDLKTLKTLIVEDLGQTRTSQSLFQEVKVMLSQCVEDGMIPASPGNGIKDIHYQEKKRSALTPDVIKALIDHPEEFANTEEWALFTVIATTGMRLSEALALAHFQIAHGTLTINRALKSTAKDDVGLPKWNIVRAIPLSEITKKALDSIEPDETGRYFHHNKCWATTCFNRINGMAKAMHMGIDNLTAHVLRHSLNSNLLALGLSPVLVAEYLSWSHQELLDIQQRYTHIQVQHLHPIAEAIDSLYGKGKVYDARKIGYSFM